MNKLKFTNYNTLGQPQNVILKYENGDTEVLDYFPTTRYYDSFDKKYISFNKFSTINNRNYV
jgi:hypothetical protein